jgi:hypothetical protein
MALFAVDLHPYRIKFSEEDISDTVAIYDIHTKEVSSCNNS